MLEDNGFSFEMTADVPGSELALFAYYVDAFGTRIEIVDRTLFPDFPAFLQSQAQVAGHDHCRYCGSISPPRVEILARRANLSVRHSNWRSGASPEASPRSASTNTTRPGTGWSCNPIMAASMFLARTSTLIASVDCALGPLWNPVRLAEDIALVDNMSRGRLHTTVGLGYPNRRISTRSVWISASAAR